MIATGTATAVKIRATRNGHRPGRRCWVRLSSAFWLKKSVKRIGNRELPAQLERALVDRIQRRRVFDALDQVGDAVRDDYHLSFSHTAGSDERCADAYPAGVELRRVVERDRVAVQRDAHGVGDVLHLFP